MFQAGHFSTSDHDYLADLPNRHKRLKSVLKFLERKHLHAPFLDVLKSLHHASVIATLQTERQFIPKPCKLYIPYLVNFTEIYNKQNNT